MRWLFILSALLCSLVAMPTAGRASGFDLAAFVATGEAGDVVLIALAADPAGRIRRGPHLPPPAPKPATPPSITPPAPAWNLAGRLTLTSDFRRGGISSSGGKPAMQAELTAEHRSGLFATGWGSNVADNGGANLEIDLSAGFAKTIDQVEVSALLLGYVFPGVRDSFYVEAGAEVVRTVGQTRIGVGAAYVPAQANTGHRDNLYLGVFAEQPIAHSPVTIEVALGREHGAFGDRKLDWSVGARAALKRVELLVAYVDSRRAGVPHSGATLIAGLTLVL